MHDLELFMNEFAEAIPYLVAVSAGAAFVSFLLDVYFRRQNDRLPVAILVNVLIGLLAVALFVTAGFLISWKSSSFGGEANIAVVSVGLALAIISQSKRYLLLHFKIVRAHEHRLAWACALLHSLVPILAMLFVFALGSSYQN